MSRTPPYPPWKWVGGKKRLVPHILARLPQKINTYYEPFVGGGAVLIELAKQDKFKWACISDKNQDISNAWKVIKKYPEQLIKCLRKKKYVYDKEAYLRIRKLNSNKLDDIERAARFIYLNKTGFNGLYRLNAKGEFNVPFGRHKDPVICDAPNIRKLSELLKRVDIHNIDFGEFDYIKPGDAVYFDPPYLPTSKTSYFTAYTSTGFTEDDHRRLAERFRALGDKKVRVVLTNSAAKLTYELYGEFDIDSREQNQCIGGPAEYRKSITEVIVFHGPKN